MIGRIGEQYLLLNLLPLLAAVLFATSHAPKMYKGIWQIREKTKCPMLILWII